MSPELAATATRPEAAAALVVIPRSVNYFYNVNGQRIASALRELGYRVDVAALGEPTGERYDAVFLSNLFEILHAYGDRDAGLAAVRDLAGRSGLIAAVSLDSAMTHWFRQSNDLCAAAGVPIHADLGLWDQSPYVEPHPEVRYAFVRDGLTREERAELDGLDGDPGRRPIPWAFVGHATADRAAFVDFLVRRVDPGGFVYIPPLEPVTESGSAHLDRRQFVRVLRASRTHVWCSHHRHFYMEPERFRYALLAGCLPVKALPDGQEVPADAPLAELMVPRSGLADVVRSPRIDRLWGRLRDEYLAHPLESSIGAFLARHRPAVGAAVARRVAV